MSLAEDGTTTDPIVASLGSRIRALRKAQQKSLSDVAASTGISASFLSLVENGKSDLTIGRLARLVDYFGVDLDDLLPTGFDRADPVTVTSPDQSRSVRSDAEGVDIMLLAPGGNHDLQPMQLVLQPGAHLSDFGVHRGDEFVYVISGTLQVEFEGREPVVAGAGWSVTYPGDIPHRFHNPSEDTLRIVCVNSRGSGPHGTL